MVPPPIWRGMSGAFRGNGRSSIARPFTLAFPAPLWKGIKMKWPKPRKYIEDEIKNPIRTIGVIAVLALALSAMALFYVMGKDANNAA